MHLKFSESLAEWLICCKVESKQWREKVLLCIKYQTWIVCVVCSAEPWRNTGTLVALMSTWQLFYMRVKDLPATLWCRLQPWPIFKHLLKSASWLDLIENTLYSTKRAGMQIFLSSIHKERQGKMLNCQKSELECVLQELRSLSWY